MSEKKNSLLIIKNTVAIFFAAVFFTFLTSEFELKAAGRTKITSMDEFYVAISNQIYNHEVDVTYDVSDYNLVKKIMDISMEDYQFHYDEKHPLISGCYLSYYIDYMSLYYSHGTLRIVIQFKYSKADMDEHFSMMKELALKLKKDTTFDTILNVHDYLIENFEYDKKTIYVNHTDIDGFKDNQMVCSGYSLAAYYLLNEAGIPTMVITGYGGNGAPNESNHMWNMVFLDDNWYNLDITWDDINGKKPAYNYFLKSDKDFTEHVRLGRYDIDYFKYAVAEKSYKLPMKLKYGDFKIYIFIVTILLTAIFFLSSIINSRHKKQVQNSYRNVSEIYNGYGLNDIDDFISGQPDMTDNDNHPDIMDAQNQVSQAFNDDKIPRL